MPNYTTTATLYVEISRSVTADNLNQAADSISDQVNDFQERLTGLESTVGDEVSFTVLEVNNVDVEEISPPPAIPSANGYTSMGTLYSQSNSQSQSPVETPLGYTRLVN